MRWFTKFTTEFVAKFVTECFTPGVFCAQSCQTLVITVFCKQSHQTLLITVCPMGTEVLFPPPMNACATKRARGSRSPNNAFVKLLTLGVTRHARRAHFLVTCLISVQGAEVPIWVCRSTLAPVVFILAFATGEGIQAISRWWSRPNQPWNYKKTSQELRMLSSVTLNCQVTKIVMNSGSQLSWL